MTDDTTEGLAEHSSRLQPSINLHAPVTPFIMRFVRKYTYHFSNSLDWLYFAAYQTSREYD